MAHVRLFVFSAPILLALGIHSDVSANFVATPNPQAPIMGNLTADTSGKSNAGTILFDWDGTNAPPEKNGRWEPFVHHVSWQPLYVHGNFWLETVGWASFDICSEGMVNTVSGCTLSGGKNTDVHRPRLIGNGAADANGFYDTYRVEWSAWSENAGWILLKHDSPSSANVRYDRKEWRLHGYGWSDGLGWINFENLVLDITPPSIPTSFEVFSTDHAKNLQILDDGAIWAASLWRLWNYEIAVDHWNSTADLIYSGTWFEHDFRKSKEYGITVKDAFGNSISWKLNVVSGAPTSSLVPGKGIDPSAAATSYQDDFANPKIADGKATHSFVLKLRDRYGNPVVSVPWIKKAGVSLAYENGLDANQLNEYSPFGMWNLDLGDAVEFPDNVFAGLTYLSWTVGKRENATDGVWSWFTASYAPSSRWYSFTTLGNDIGVSRLSYEVKAEWGRSWVWETSEMPIPQASLNPMAFVPALQVDETSVSMNGSDAWNLTYWYEAIFEAGILKNGASAISDVNISTILDINKTNSSLSYQKPNEISGGSPLCEWYAKSAPWLASEYVMSGSQSELCDRSIQEYGVNSSNLTIFKSGATGNFSVRFGWTPSKIISATPKENSIRFASELSYVINGRLVQHPSFRKETLSKDEEKPDFQAVKIIGNTNAKGTAFEVVEGNSVHLIGWLSKSETRNMVWRNVEEAIRSRKDFSGTDMIVTYGDYELPATWPNGKQTIVVKGWNVLIRHDIPGWDRPYAIVALSDWNLSKGDVWIHPGVRNVKATIYADGSLFSGNGTSHVADNPETWSGQLLIEWSVISNNTVGWSSVSPLKCPPLKIGNQTCSEAEAKRWDFNLFRFYKTDPDGAWPEKWIGTPANGVPAEGQPFPFVILYDPRMLTHPPWIFTIR